MKNIFLASTHLGLVGNDGVLHFIELKRKASFITTAFLNYNHFTAIIIYKNKSLVTYRKLINTGKNPVIFSVI